MNGTTTSRQGDVQGKAGRGFRLPAALLLAGILLTAGAFASAALAQASLRIGTAPPRVSVADLGGRPLRIPDDVRGKVVIVHFWAAGCSSCKEEMPAMEALYTRYARQGLEVLAVNVGQRREKVQSFLSSMKLTYPVYLDPQAQAAREYEVVGVPKTFILDRSGQIRYKIVGGASKESLNKLVSSLL